MGTRTEIGIGMELRLRSALAANEAGQQSNNNKDNDKVCVLTDGEDASKDGCGFVESGTVPALGMELVLALGDAHLGPQADRLQHVKHDAL